MKTQFQRDAWQALSEDPTRAYYRYELVDGVLALRYATADLMRADCVECPSCLTDKANVPVQFTVEQPGGTTGPLTQIVLTDQNGRARPPIILDDCEQPIQIRARVVGRPDAVVVYDVTCLPRS